MSGVTGTISGDKAFALAFQQYRSARLAEAEQTCLYILAHQPDHADALHLLGVIALNVNQPDQALPLLARAVSCCPNNAEFHCNLGLALAAHRRFDEALAEYDKSVALRAGYANPLNHRGTALFNLGRADEAIVSYRRALALRPDDVDTLQNLGCVLLVAGQVDEAIELHRKAVALRPQSPRTHSNLALDLDSSGQSEEAIAELQKAVQLAPTNAEMHNNLGYVLKDAGQLDQAIASYDRAIACDPTRPDIVSNRLLLLAYHPTFDNHALAAEQRKWNQTYAAPLAHLIKAHTNDRNPDRKLRIGYLSADFRDHIAGKMMLPLILRRNRDQFEVFCYSNTVQSDETTAKFRGLSDGFRSIINMDDDSATSLIRADGIDILIECSGHMAGNRLLVTARKPAPVQVMFISYPGSTGMTTLDYRFTDPYLDPEGIDESLYSEKTVRLSDTFWCYDPESMNAPREPVSELPAQKNGYSTFGCVNNFVKVNDGVLELWSRVMRKVPNSHLLLLAPEGEARRRVTDKMKQEGIEPSRLEFVPRVGREEYLKYFSRMDIGLDTVPYNGHTTSLDGMWMGVASVTLIGQTIVGRGGFSELSNVGLPEISARTPEEFVKIASELGDDVDRQRHLRQTMRERMERSPLCDGARWVSNIESEYRRIGRKWCEK
jgi:protein O-GlcNAc transferase